MASPFNVFRKYQKTLLVVAGVILMFVFVIGDSLVPYLRSSDPSQGGRSPSAVAVRWNGGSLTNQELDMAKTRRALVNAFTRSVFYAGAEASQMAGIEPRPIKVEPLIGPETPEEGIEKDIVRLKVFADAARAAGMSVSNENIARYLDELGRGYVSREDMRTMMAQLQGVSTDFMFDAIREEMLARNYLASYQYALETVTPEERWRDWQRVNDRVVVEAAAIPAESFVVDVPEPTNEELLAFYDEYKLREPMPDVRGTMELPSPVPGFRVPRRYNLKYLVANYDKFLEKVESEVTDEEIEKFYEEKKDPQFVKTDTELFDDLMGDSATGAAPATDTTPAESEATDDSEAGEAGETNAEATENTEPKDSAAESESDGAPSEGAPAPGDAAPESEAGSSAEEPAAEAPASAESSSHDSAAKPSLFRLAAFLQDAEADSAEQPADSAETAGDDASTTEETPVTTAETATVENADAPAVDSPAAETTNKPLEFQPLDEVRDVIRREIAGQKTSEQLIALMNEIKGELASEFNEYFGAVLNAEAQGKERPAPPASLVDLAAIAAKHGLESGETGLKSILELRSTPVGESAEIDSDESLLRMLFTEDLELYQPVLTRDLDANRYVVMKVEDIAGRVPKLEEIRDEVVRAWKLSKAAELAEKDAERKAKEAEESGLSLAEFFADNDQVEVVRTDPFSWLTGGAISRISGQQDPFRLSEPEGIEAAGPEFMQVVFDLEGDDVGSALNHDHSIAYVLRVADRQSTPEELHQNYLAEANTWDGLNIMTRSHAQTSAQLLVSEMLKDAEVDWVRNPDEPPAAPSEGADANDET